MVERKLKFEKLILKTVNNIDNYLPEVGEIVIGEDGFKIKLKNGTVFDSRRIEATDPGIQESIINISTAVDQILRIIDETKNTISNETDVKIEEATKDKANKSDLYTKEEVDELISNLIENTPDLGIRIYEDIERIQTSLEEKVTEEELETVRENLEVALEEVNNSKYSKEEIDSTVENITSTLNNEIDQVKENIRTNIDNISNELEKKASKEEVYTITDINELISGLTDEVQNISEKLDGDIDALEQSLNQKPSNNDLEDAFEEVFSLAKQCNKAKGFNDYSDLINELNIESQDTYPVGQSFLIATLNVPDLWVKEISNIQIEHIYSDDELLISELNENGYIQIGYYILCALETLKQDLTNYIKKTNFASTDEAGIVKINKNQGINVDSTTGTLAINPSTEYEISLKTNSYKPIVPNKLDYSVKMALADCKLVGANAWTEEEKANARELLGISSTNTEDSFQGYLRENVPYSSNVLIPINKEYNISTLLGNINISIEDVENYNYVKEWSFTITQGNRAYNVTLPPIYWGLGIAPTFGTNSTTICRLYFIGNRLCGEWVSI